LALFLFCSNVASPWDKAAMTQPTAQTVMRNRAAVAEELRRLLPRMEGVRATRSSPFGLAAIDRSLPQGGLACGALHEIVPEAGATAAAFGFLVALLARASSPLAYDRANACCRDEISHRVQQHSSSPCKGEDRWGSAASRQALTSQMEAGHAAHHLHYEQAARDPHPDPPPFRGRERAIPHQSQSRPLILVLPTYGLRDYGRPYGHGLRALGLDPSRLIIAETAHRKDTLWAMEEALRSRAPAAVAGIIDRLDLKTSQRLHLAAADCGLPLLLLRPAEMLDASAAATRWRVGPAPAARDRFGLITRARWRLSLERCRNGRTGEWMVEYDHVAHRFSLAAALADPAVLRRAGEAPFRRAG
jgi:protein ImuA